MSLEMIYDTRPMDERGIHDEHGIHMDRTLTMPISALGALRRELIETLGVDRAKGFLLRVGWHCGASDAMKMRSMEWDEELDAFLAGPRLHALHGYLSESKFLRCEIDSSQGTLVIEGRWRNSYEAQVHKQMIGISRHPVCYTLVGYASGYLSTLFGRQVIAMETKCEAMGHDHCLCVCRTLEEWHGQVYEELRYYQSNRIIDELEEMFSKLQTERANLGKVYRIQRSLTQEVLHERNLSFIADTFTEITQLPLVITDSFLNPLATSGMAKSKVASCLVELSKHWRRTHSQTSLARPTLQQTTTIEFGPGRSALMTPLLHNRHAGGYCVVFYEGQQPEDVHPLMLEQAAVACSLYLFNEQTRFDTEQRMRGDFLDDLLSNRQIVADEMTRRAHYIGFQFQSPYFLLTLGPAQGKMSVEERVSVQEHLLRLTSSFTKQRRLNALVGQREGNVVVLVARHPEYRECTRREELCQQLRAYVQAAWPERIVKVGMSSVSDVTADLQELYSESVAAFRLACGQAHIKVFDTLGVEGVLCKDVDSARKFARRWLGPLLMTDRDKELTKTLYYFLNNGGNVHKTARVMNFSISGLRYRLQRLSEILDCHLQNPYVANQLYTGLLLLLSIGDLEFEDCPTAITEERMS
ncbi:XylR N-terminal domain-containing protein [Alicyclobacillus herbarius]|uniref:XylR N-terminal domain-containing protein n=1 Tax=Alicyclobacillus herbarius TaxID=122960 RepID=UPI0003FFE90C|nr:XylR N-terminal domain-containing protein [Alicyclobacillus herbarius]